MSHTPGPWFAFPTGMRGNYGVGRHVAHVHIPQTVPHEQSVMDTDGEDGGSVTQANCRLIAAAPELLEALKGALIHIVYLHHKWGLTVEERNALIPIKDALAKAEGK